MGGLLRTGAVRIDAHGDFHAARTLMRLVFIPGGLCWHSDATTEAKNDM